MPAPTTPLYHLDPLRWGQVVDEELVYLCNFDPIPAITSARIELIDTSHTPDSSGHVSRTPHTILAREVITGESIAFHATSGLEKLGPYAEQDEKTRILLTGPEARFRTRSQAHRALDDIARLLTPHTNRQSSEIGNLSREISGIIDTVKG